MFPYPQSLVDIPPIFHSVEFDGPFQKCQICTRELYEDAQAYMIEKVFRGPETIIEIATCLPCAFEMQNEISAESAQTMQTEFHSKVNMNERLEWLGNGGQSLEETVSEESESEESASEGESAAQASTSKETDKVSEESELVTDLGQSNPINSPDPERWLESCILTGKSRDQTPNFQVVGMFMGDKMVLSIFPYLISAKAIEEIGEKLSNETRGYMQDFIDTQFGMPPEFCNPESPLPLLI